MNVCVTRHEQITRFAGFAQTMSSTNPTAACRTQIGRVGAANDRVLQRLQLEGTVYFREGTVRGQMVCRADTIR